MTEPDGHLRAYARLIVSLLDDCVVYRGHAPEIFLWSARRTAEALCLMILSHREGRSVSGRRQDATLAKLIEQVAKDDSAILSIFTLVRELSNIGVHVSGPSREKFERLERLGPEALVQVVTWAFTESPAAAELQALPEWPQVLDRLQRLKQPPLSSKPLALQVEELRKERAELNEQMAHLQADLVGLEGQRARLLGENDQLQGAVAAERTEVGRHKRRALQTGFFGTGAGFGMGLFIGLCAPVGLWAAGALPERGRSTALTADPPVAEVAPLAAAPAPAPTPPPAPSCPAGMELVPEGLVHLGQPIGGRTDWPPARPAKLDPEVVPAFCVDTRPVRWRELAHLPRPSDCNRPEEGGGDDDPGGCRTQQEAEAFCVDREARLPTILEWERLKRLQKRREIPWLETGIYREWVNDSFPPAVFNRPDDARPQKYAHLFREPLETTSKLRDEGDVLWSWNAAAADKRLHNLGFRCAVALSAVRGG